MAEAAGHHAESELYGRFLREIGWLLKKAPQTYLSEQQLKELYNDYWRDWFPFTASYKNHEMVDRCLKSGLEFDSALEIGTGNGDGVKKMLAAGKQARVSRRWFGLVPQVW